LEEVDVRGAEGFGEGVDLDEWEVGGEMESVQGLLLGPRESVRVCRFGHEDGVYYSEIEGCVGCLESSKEVCCGLGV
jgi:hypothetical protein